jgi:very-short-patch-repair endonuclease
MAKSKLEESMAQILDGLNLPYVREYKFHPVRRWRFDFYLPEHKTGIECEGGIFGGGRHSRALGMAQDAEKYNEAVIMDIRVLRFTTLDFKPANQEKVRETILRLVG